MQIQADSTQAEFIYAIRISCLSAFKVRTGAMQIPGRKSLYNCLSKPSKDRKGRHNQKDAIIETDKTPSIILRYDIIEFHKIKTNRPPSFEGQTHPTQTTNAQYHTLLSPRPPPRASFVLPSSPSSPSSASSFLLRPPRLHFPRNMVNRHSSSRQYGDTALNMAN